MGGVCPLLVISKGCFVFFVWIMGKVFFHSYCVCVSGNAAFVYVCDVCLFCVESSVSFLL